jgi:V-type H+-transporting ATPase subunit E
MSAIHALSDDQVAGELKKMTAFIRQEAYEKAKEIEIKADEEFAIEKSKLVRQETAAIDSTFEKRFKHASMSQQIARSTLANRSRLRVLAARQELLDALFDHSRTKVATVAADKKRYQKLLSLLTLEGMYHMDEPHMQVRARKADYDVTRAAIDDATKEYRSKTGKDVKLTLDEGQPLPAGSYVFLFWERVLTPQDWWGDRIRHRGQDRDQQHAGRAAAAAGDGGATVDPTHAVRRQQEPAVQGLTDRRIEACFDRCQ